MCSDITQRLFVSNVYLSHPEVTSHNGEDIAKLLLSAVGNTLGWSIRNIRERFYRGSFDNVPYHFAEKLSQEKEFTKEAITWDIANQLVTGIELNIAINNGQHHTQLRDTALEMEMIFLEFGLFSETHSMLTEHTTILITKIQKGVISREIPAALAQESEHTEKLLALVTFILQLSFKREIC